MIWCMNNIMQEDQPQNTSSEPRPRRQGRVMAPGQYISYCIVYVVR
jgi:hypothetical protein